MSHKLVPSVLTVTPQIPLKGVHYIGQYGTSGYATAAKGYLYHYFSEGIPLTWEPLYFDDSKLSDDDMYDIIVKSLINKPLPQHDMVIMHCTPDLWPKLWRDNPKTFVGRIIGYCTWETNRLPKYWVECINNCVNEVWCPSTYNETTFRESGVTTPIRVVPHIFLPHRLPDPASVKLMNVKTGDRVQADGQYTFYTIGEMNERKGIADTIQAFCKAFKESDPVRLILKVHYRSYSFENKVKCEDMLGEELKKYPSHPLIICLLEPMTQNEMMAIHSIGDCYLALVKSEGFGLTIFDAFKYGKKVIATGYSGHLDFLGKDYSGLVQYKLDTVKGMTSFSTNYTDEQIWAYPDIDHAVELMRKAIQ